MVGGVVVVQHLDALELGEPVGKLIGLSGRDVGHHDVGSLGIGINEQNLLI